MPKLKGLGWSGYFRFIKEQTIRELQENNMGKTAGLNSILRSTLAKIDAQIHALESENVRLNESNQTNFSVYERVDMNGVPVMIGLLQARANVLLAMAIDNQ